MTPTTPRKPMTAPQTVAPAAGNAPPAQTPAGAAPGKKKHLVAIIAIAALVVAGAGGIVLWKTLNPGPPPPTGPSDRIAAFVSSSKFAEVPWSKKLEYFGTSDQREEEYEKLYRAGKLSQPQMGMVREAAWLGKNLGRMVKYYSLPPGQQRTDNLHKVVDKIDDVDEPPKTKGPPEEKLPKRDKKWGKQMIATAPADVQAQWKDFQKAINDEQDRRKKEKKAAERAAAATRPATKPSKSAG